MAEPDRHQSAVDKVLHLPSERTCFALLIDKALLYEAKTNELTFRTLPVYMKRIFQYMTYLTYIHTGSIFQIELDNPLVCATTPGVRSELSVFALFVFVFENVNPDDAGSSFTSAAAAGAGTADDVFRRVLEQAVGNMLSTANERDERDCGFSYHDEYRLKLTCLKALQRLLLYKHRLANFNHVMLARTKTDVDEMIRHVDVKRDTLEIRTNISKQLHAFGGTLLQSNPHPAIPKLMTDFSFKKLVWSFKKYLNESTDEDHDIIATASVEDIMWNSISQLRLENVFSLEAFSRYADRLNSDSAARLRTLIQDIADPRLTKVTVGNNILFRYSTDDLITMTDPCKFESLKLHGYSPVPKTVLSILLSTNNVPVSCAGDRGSSAERCCLDCLSVYAAVYNNVDVDTLKSFLNGHRSFGNLWPHLKELKIICEQYSANGPVPYRERVELGDVILKYLLECRLKAPENVKLFFAAMRKVYDEREHAASFSLSELKRCAFSSSAMFENRFSEREGGGGERGERPFEDSQACVRYTAEVMRNLFQAHFNVTRVFQACVTFMYAIANGAPGYTKDRMMLINFSAPGEGKSFTNYVIKTLFCSLRGFLCELTSFTNQSFKYKDVKTLCNVLIDDAAVPADNAKYRSKDAQNVPNMFKNMLDTGTLICEVPLRNQSTNAFVTECVESVQNCGVVWSTNSLEIFSDAWKDRTYLMGSEYGLPAARSLTTESVEKVAEANKLSAAAERLLFRQNLMQTIIYLLDVSSLQFTESYDAVRDKVIVDFLASHVARNVSADQRTLNKLNKLVFADAFTAACNFVFDLWIPPWTSIPSPKDVTVERYVPALNEARVIALRRMKVYQVTLEICAALRVFTAPALAEYAPKMFSEETNVAVALLGALLKNVDSLETSSVGFVSNKYFVVSGIVVKNALSRLSQPMREMGIKMDSEGRAFRTVLENAGKMKIPNVYNEGDNKLVTVKFRKNESCATHSVDLQFFPYALYGILGLTDERVVAEFWTKILDAGEKAWREQAARSDDLENLRRGLLCGGGKQNRKKPSVAYTMSLTEDSLSPAEVRLLECVEAFSEGFVIKSKPYLDERRYDISASATTNCIFLQLNLLNRIAGDPEELGIYDPAECDRVYGVEKLCHVSADDFHKRRVSVYDRTYAGTKTPGAVNFCKAIKVCIRDRLYVNALKSSAAAASPEFADWELKDAVRVFEAGTGSDSQIVTPESVATDYSHVMQFSSESQDLAREDPMVIKLRRRLKYVSDKYERNIEAVMRNRYGSAHVSKKPRRN